MAVQAQPHFQDWIDTNLNGCGGGINQFHLHHQHCNSHLHYLPSAPKIASPIQSMAAYEDLQMQEVDHCIRLQNEKLRLLMHEQRKQQIALLMKKIESKALPLLRKKDVEIAQAAKRTMELEDFLRRLEMQNQAWQRAAQENEAIVVSLNNTIEQMREKAATYCFNNGVEDAESCCDVLNREEEEETEIPDRVVDSNLTGERKKKTVMMLCKGCNSRKSCILFLPCRHLCSCKSCEAFLDSCPVCLAGKKASIEALIV